MQISLFIMLYAVLGLVSAAPTPHSFAKARSIARIHNRGNGSEPAGDTQSFSNSGTVPAGWDGTNKEHKGTVSEVTDVTYKGDTAIKVTQTFDESYSGRYHSEAFTRSGYKLGQQGFYGFAFRLAPDWQSSPAQSYNLAQFIADFGDTGCDDFMPSSMVWVIGNKLATRLKSGTACNQDTKEFTDLATVKPGVWHRVVIQADWQKDKSGSYKLFFDGEQVLEKSNVPTTVDDKREFQFRVGLYANGWHDDKGMKGTQGFRQVWYDQIGIGSTMADADPDQSE